ncbi:MAG: alpha/beta fold hydrolase [Actinomycetota bacterium]|nr:alpha/beta hydrolase [Actinomycetota bacterium]
MPIQVVLLPGGVLPAEFAYGGLINELGPGVDARPKELEVYKDGMPPAGYSFHLEIEGILRHADAAGFDRFHLVGYSAGGASCLAFTASHPDRLLSLTLNEPAWAGNEGLSPEEQERWKIFDHLSELPFVELMPAFVRAQLRDGVAPPPPPEGPPPPWMETRPAGIRTFIETFKTSKLDVEALRTFDKPVLFTLGGKSHPWYYAEIAKRLATIFPDFTLEVFEDRHHFDPPHRTETKRFAELLLGFWEKAANPK